MFIKDSRDYEDLGWERGDELPYRPSDVQIGGDHYKKYPIQPGYYAHMNKLSPMVFNAVKYVTRYQDKGGAEDLHKAINCIAMLLEWEYPNDPKIWKQVEKVF